MRFMSGYVIINCSDAKQKLGSTLKSSPTQSNTVNNCERDQRVDFVYSTDSARVSKRLCIMEKKKGAGVGTVTSHTTTG